MGTFNSTDPELDPAAIFGCALSLHEEIQRRIRSDKEIKLSEIFCGYDEYMRVLMEVARKFEEWSCRHVNFNSLNEVWPYLLSDRFGPVCLEIFSIPGLTSFEDADCLHVSFKLRLPVKFETNLPIPVDVTAENPFCGSSFKSYRILTFRMGEDSEDCEPYTFDDDPYDDNYGPVLFGIYGVTDDGIREHIADRKSYVEALCLVRNLVPGISLPDNPTP